jgi:hypothetical protein
MDLTAALILNIALGLLAFTGIGGLATWAIRTGERSSTRSRVLTTAGAR